MNTICVSVIVPAYNASATIGVALEALTKQNFPLPFEIIIVDDGSDDDTAKIVRSFPSIKYIHQENSGPASARNHGARSARGEYLAFTDSDCIAHEDWVTKLMKGFVRSQVGVVAGSYGIANPGNWLARCICKEILWRHAHLMKDFPNAFGSYNFCVRKNVFDTVGGFDTSYRRASGEDNDLSYKVIKSGWKIYFQRKAIVDHYHTTKFLKYLKEQCRHGFWRAKIYKDHPRMMRPDGYTFWKDIIEMPIAGCFLLAVVLSLLGVVPWNGILKFILFPFLMFEILFSLLMTRLFWEGILFGFVLLFRAFARMLGLSTGILSLLLRLRQTSP